ncbi:MAG: hypothetical protein Q9M29_03590 [Mariprofundaceae bacterium]|nr:hypothetical protein [Mariprofundaceae bacterium]
MTASSITLQEAMDRFVQADVTGDAGRMRHAGHCMEALAEYLLHCSDLFHDAEMREEGPPMEWEQALDSHMAELFEGDLAPVPDLGNAPLAKLDPEHVRDFLAWFLLREVAADGDIIREYADILRAWFDFLYEKGWWRGTTRISFMAVLADVEPDAVRAARAARVLFHFVRHGGGVPPRLRGQRFSRFIEGHARISAIDHTRICFRFDSQDIEIGPVTLPNIIAGLLQVGDVLDIELGLRGDIWVIVDIGPLYPACVYMEAEEFDLPEKTS